MPMPIPANVTAEMEDPVEKTMNFVKQVIEKSLSGAIRLFNFLPTLILALVALWIGIRLINGLAQFLQKKLEMIRVPPKGGSIRFVQDKVQGQSGRSGRACCAQESSGEDSDESMPQGYHPLAIPSGNNESDGAQPIPPVLLHFAVSSIRLLLKFMLTVSLASMVGFNTTDLIALFSMLALSIGLATKSLFSDVARGIILILFRPYDEGDLVNVNGVIGKVSRVSIIETCFTTLDSKTVFVPNSLVRVITNYYTGHTLREDVKFKIANVQDITVAKSILLKIAKEHPKVLQDPAPVVLVAEQTDIGIEIWIRLHVQAADFIPVPFSVREQGLLALHAQGIMLAKGFILDGKKTS